MRREGRRDAPRRPARADPHASAERVRQAQDAPVQGREGNTWRITSRPSCASRASSSECSARSARSLSLAFGLSSWASWATRGSARRAETSAADKLAEIGDVGPERPAAILGRVRPPRRAQPRAEILEHRRRGPGGERPHASRSVRHETQPTGRLALPNPGQSQQHAAGPSKHLLGRPPDAAPARAVRSGHGQRRSLVAKAIVEAPRASSGEAIVPLFQAQRYPRRPRLSATASLGA